MSVAYCLWSFFALVVLYGYQGADGDAEQLSLTDQLFDAALGELRVVALDQPCLIVGDFNVEPTKIPCLSKGIFAGLWVDLESAWAFASGVPPAATCKRSLNDPGGHRRDFMVGVSSCCGCGSFLFCSAGSVGCSSFGGSCFFSLLQLDCSSFSAG